MIEIQGLNVIYNNDYQALANVSITLEEGNIIGVLDQMVQGNQLL